MSNLLSNIPYELFSYIGGGIFLFIILYKFFPNLFIKIHKPVFFTIGILSLSLGYVGIVIPGLPTTVFILIAAWADEMTEIKTICKSGKKATMNARLDENGNRVTEGDQISIGLNYEAQARDVFELDKVSPIGYQIPEAN